MAVVGGSDASGSSADAVVAVVVALLCLIPSIAFQSYAGFPSCFVALFVAAVVVYVVGSNSNSKSSQLLQFVFHSLCVSMFVFLLGQLY